MSLGTDTAVNSAPASAGPSTFAEAFAADASPASSTPEQTPTPSAAEQPTDAQETTPATEDRSPFIPRTRFDEVNGKYNELKQWREQYAWAEQVDRTAVEQAITLAQRYGADKVGFLQELIADAQNDPQAAQQLRSMAARALAQGRGQQQPAETPNYDSLVIDLGNGQSIAMSDLKAQWMAEVRHELQPVVKTVEQVSAERAHLKAEHDAQQFAGTLMQKAAKRPGMDDPENKRAIAEYIKAQRITSDDPKDLHIAFDEAYLHVVLPKLNSKAQSQLLDNLQSKAHASTSVNPGSAAPSTPKAISSFSQLGPDAWK